MRAGKLRHGGRDLSRKDLKEIALRRDNLKIRKEERSSRPFPKYGKVFL